MWRLINSSRVRRACPTVLGVVSLGGLRHFKQHHLEQGHEVNPQVVVVASQFGLG